MAVIESGAGMHDRFDGRVAIVTGAAHGIGRALALAFAELGARVVGCDILVEELRETARLATASGWECQACSLDVSNHAAVIAMAGETLAAFGRIDILVNNAGGGLGQTG